MIEQMYSICYGDKMEENEHLSQLFADYLCFCRASRTDECPAPILIQAARRADFEIPDGTIPMEFAWLNHPAVAKVAYGIEADADVLEHPEDYVFPTQKIISNALVSHASMKLLSPSPPAKDRDGQGAQGVTDSHEQRPPFPNAEQAERPMGQPYAEVLCARAAFFADMATTYYGSDAESFNECLIHLFRDVLVSLEDAEQFRHALAAASQKYTTIMGLRFNILMDELYTYDELVEFVEGDAAEVDKALREIGYDPTEKPMVRGAEIVEYFEKKT